jgi:hypothetical protein
LTCECAPLGTFETSRQTVKMSACRKWLGFCQTVANDSSVWTGRALQAECENMKGLVLRICIPPLHGAFVLLAIMDIRAHPISFSERP